MFVKMINLSDQCVATQDDKFYALSSQKSRKIRRIGKICIYCKPTFVSRPSKSVKIYSFYFK